MLPEYARQLDAGVTGDVDDARFYFIHCFFSAGLMSIY
jgi:hypothetical protein